MISCLCIRVCVCVCVCEVVGVDMYQYMPHIQIYACTIVIGRATLIVIIYKVDPYDLTAYPDFSWSFKQLTE